MSPREAILDGVRRGAEMALDPATTFQADMRRYRSREGATTRAWRTTGESMRKAMREVDNATLRRAPKK